MKWTLPLNGAYEGSTPCTSHEGIIYFGTTSDKVYAVNPDGTIRWENTFSWSQSPAAIGEDGTVYIGSANYLRAFGPGPFRIDAKGPYTGLVNHSIFFTSAVFGGRWPYTYHWDFGDNKTSDEQNPNHWYTIGGIFNVTLTVWDSDGNTSTVTTTATIGYPPPIIHITRPGYGIYLLNIRVLPWITILVLGPITIKANVTPNPLPIVRVEFTVDGYTKKTFTSPPYTWTWWVPAFGEHYISVKAWDTAGSNDEYISRVWKFF